MALKLRKRMKNSPSLVHVLHKTSDFVISRFCFTEDDGDIDQNLKRTFRAIFLLIKPIPRYRRCRRLCCLSSLKLIIIDTAP